MAEEAGTVHIPEYVSDEVAQEIRSLTRETEPVLGPVEVSEYLVRHWCEALEDGNPLYLDEAFARSRGYRGLVAPPGLLVGTLTTPFRWPWPPNGQQQERNIHHYLKALLNLPVAIATDLEMEYYRYLQVGDRVKVSQQLVSISPWKKTRLGEGHFWTVDRIYRDMKDQIVARARQTYFAYGREVQ